jgi:hypothetical protein
LKDYWQVSISKAISKLVHFGTIAISLMGAWQIRNYKISDQFIGLNPIFDPPQVFLPPLLLNPIGSLLVVWQKKKYLFPCGNRSSVHLANTRFNID